MERKVFTLNDDVIAQVARLVQIGFVLGEDLTDHFRQIVVEENEQGKLSLTPEYMEHDNQVVDQLFAELQRKLSDETPEVKH